MESAAEYLKRTESASRKLFEGIESYIGGLQRAVPPVFVSSSPNPQQAEAEFKAWERRHETEIAASLQAQRDYFAESFALATLCGSVLQIAAKGIENFSRNETIPHDWAGLIKPGQKVVRYCIGRVERSVPLGLIILAGRNQQMHFGDEPLREPNVTIFARLASFGTPDGDEAVRDPAFDLANKNLVSFAHNITALIGWRSFDTYQRDLRELLKQ